MLREVRHSANPSVTGFVDLIDLREKSSGHGKNLDDVLFLALRPSYLLRDTGRKIK